jgi:hypothetical protein
MGTQVLCMWYKYILWVVGYCEFQIYSTLMASCWFEFGGLSEKSWIHVIKIKIVLFGVFVLVVTTCVYLCAYHLLPILLSSDEVLFCGCLSLKLLSTDRCLTLINYLVVQYGSVIPWVLFELMILFIVIWKLDFVWCWCTVVKGMDYILW